MGLRVVDLFAGVGGFRIGLDRAGGYETVWFNQWEPATKTTQHAHDCYVRQIYDGENPFSATNVDIAKVPADEIPDHDLLVGGFPCQDYSVAATLDKSRGIEGKKGVLWWEIRRILEAKRPPLVLLENVDRLLRSPARQRGRDFAILLRCLADLGYMAEWRVINAADYGNPQKRRRVFIFACRLDSAVGSGLRQRVSHRDYLREDGFFSRPFPVVAPTVDEADPEQPHVRLPTGLVEITESFGFHFLNAGVMLEGNVWTSRLVPKVEPIQTLKTILEPCPNPHYFVTKERIEGPRGWRYMKGAKDEPRTAKNGHEYRFKEGALPFPDRTDQPARTILTGEGGLSPSRSNHLVPDPGNGELRILTPEECEQLNGFKAGWTKSIPHRWRYFTMGNALVVGLVERMGRRLSELVDSHGSAADLQEPGKITKEPKSG